MSGPFFSDPKTRVCMHSIPQRKTGDAALDRIMIDDGDFARATTTTAYSTSITTSTTRCTSRIKLHGLDESPEVLELRLRRGYRRGTVENKSTIGFDLTPLVGGDPTPSPASAIGKSPSARVKSAMTSR